MLNILKEILVEIKAFSYTIPKLIIKLNKMAKTLDDLKDRVQQNSDLLDSGITLIRGIKLKLDDALAAGNTVAIQQLSDQLGAKDKEFAQAIIDNTPAEDTGEETPPEPTPEPETPPAT